jgi:hypothetical protein
MADRRGVEIELLVVIGRRAQHAHRGVLARCGVLVEIGLPVGDQVVDAIDGHQGLERHGRAVQPGLALGQGGQRRQVRPGRRAQQADAGRIQRQGGGLVLDEPGRSHHVLNVLGKDLTRRGAAIVDGEHREAVGRQMPAPVTQLFLVAAQPGPAGGGQQHRVRAGALRPIEVALQRHALHRGEGQAGLDRRHARPPDRGWRAAPCASGRPS